MQFKIRLMMGSITLKTMDAVVYTNDFGKASEMAVRCLFGLPEADRVIATRDGADEPFMAASKF